MSRSAAPAKPPRALGPTVDEGGRTLWQIYWNEDQDEPVVSMVDISNIELREGDSFQPQVRIDDESGDIVVFERNASEMEGRIQTGGSIYKKPFGKKKNREGVDMSPETSMEGRRFLVRSRSDSDLDLIPPYQRRNELCARLRWCCVSCRTLDFWKHYWWIPTVLLLAIAIYAFVTLLILKSMLGW